LKSLEQLLALSCVDDAGSAMSEADVRMQLRALEGWAMRDGAITRTYRFNNYFETIAFVNAMAYMVHRENHHPDLLVGYSHCEVRYSTHSAAGISQNDFICAAKSDLIYSRSSSRIGHA